MPENVNVDESWKIMSVRKPGIIFQSPEVFKNKSIFSYFWGMFTNFDK